MGDRLLNALLIIPLLFVPVFGHIDFRSKSFNIRTYKGDTGDLENYMAGFKPSHLANDNSPIVNDGNDGGLTGNVGSNFDTLDTQNVVKDEDTKPDPVDPTTLEAQKDVLNSNFAGSWELVSQNSGVSAMHMQLMINNKALIFDSTVLGPSAIKLAGNKPCPTRPPPAKGPDCWAHAVVYDIETAQLRPLNINTDPWCSSGGLGIDGTVVSTGGFLAGSKSVRFIKPCDTCDWEDTPDVLGAGRWYATQVKLDDGSFAVFGGRQSFTYEFIPVNGQPNKAAVNMPFLKETSDLDENNLYPFVHFLPDGNLFVFANSRAILFCARTNKIHKEYPRLHGGSRNYPASGMSALLPLKLEYTGNKLHNKPEVVICGGAKPKAYRAVGKNHTFMPALLDCGRLKVMEPDAKWKIEQMPSRRVMGDMLILPTGDLLILNGAQSGTSAWQYAKDPNFTPVVYSPYEPNKEKRFRNLQPTTIPRMYHSTSMLLPDGRILVGGSNTNPTYLFTNVEFPTELRMEKFSPHYLDPQLLQNYRPVNVVAAEETGAKLKYDTDFIVKFQVPSLQVKPPGKDLKVTMYAPPFTTHGWSMGQRLVQPGETKIRFKAGGAITLTVKAPPNGFIAPPGYYLLFVVHRGIPSVGTWVQLTA